MADTGERTAFRRAIRPFLKVILSGNIEGVSRFRPATAFATRIEELAAKSTEGNLNAAENSEYRGYVRANKFVAILQHEAKHR
jgi:hypothetical protein